jgi:hypothetical protein
MVETSDFTDFILPPADKMANEITNSINYNIDNVRGRTTLHALYSSLTTAGVDVSNHQTEVALTADGPDGVGSIAIGNADATVTDTRKLVLIFTSPLPLLHATTLIKKYISPYARPIKLRFLRTNRVPKPPLEEGEVLPPKPIPHTYAALNCTDLATTLVANATWASSGLPSQKKTSPTRHHHITERHYYIVFASVTLNAQGSSLIGGSAKLATPVDRSSYLAHAIDKFIRQHSTARARPEMNPADSSTHPMNMIPLMMTLTSLKPTSMPRDYMKTY